MVIMFRYYYLQALTPPDDLYQLESITFTAGAYTEKNNSNGALKSQQRLLPDNWKETSANISEGWYQAYLHFPTGPSAKNEQVNDKLWGIYLPVVQMNAQIYINNVLVGRIGSPAQSTYDNDPLSRVENQPYYFSIPGALLTKNKTELTIIVASDTAGEGLLGNIYLAEITKIRAAYEKRYAMLITSIATITAGMLAIAILMNVLWLLRRQDNVYGWFALTLYTWSLHNFLKTGIDLSIPRHVQNIMALLAFVWFIVFLIKAAHHFMEQKLPGRERIILITAFICSLMIIFSDSLPWSLLITHQISSTYVLVLAGYVLMDFTFKYHQRADLQNIFILPAGFSMFVFGSHDWLQLMQLIPRDDGRLLHFAAPVTVAVFGAMLLERFAGVLRKAELYNFELERRVSEKHNELEANYQRLREMEHQQLLIAERERFMKEIHDGVGGHLISMLSMVRSGKQDTDIIVSSIETALSDLRLMIDSLSPQENDIPSLLGALRSRLEPQMQSSGLQLNWQVDALPVVPNFGPHKALQVLRIVQEAVTNVIRHAQAKNIYIKAYVAQQQNKAQVIIKICDDGAGFSGDIVHGKGLDNMQYRANDIKAKICISSEPGKTCIRLAFNL